MIEILFYIFGGLTVLGALGVLLNSNVLHAALSLLASLLGVAALYVLAGADFLAVTQIMVYVGGVLVLVMFGIMLTKRTAETQVAKSGLIRNLLGWLVGIGLFAFLFMGIVELNGISPQLLKADTLDKPTTIYELGGALMSRHLLPFEVLAVLLLVALIAAVYVAGRIGEKEG